MPIERRPVRPVWADSGDRNDVPSTGAIEQGWPLSAAPPTRQRFNWILNALDGAVAYNTRRGIPDYDAAQLYQSGDRIQQGGATWRCLVDGTQGIAPGTNAQRWEAWGLTPADVLAPFAGANQLLAGSGYQRLAGGLIVQWGRVLTTGSFVGVVWTYPIAFPTRAAIVHAQPVNITAQSYSSNIGPTDNRASVTISSNYPFNADNMCLAIGY